jgi:hypothetical protein
LLVFISRKWFASQERKKIGILNKVIVWIWVRKLIFLSLTLKFYGQSWTNIGQSRIRSFSSGYLCLTHGNVVLLLEKLCWSPKQSNYLDFNTNSNFFSSF